MGQALRYGTGLAFATAAGVAGAVEFGHGPLIQWVGDPKTTAEVRWLEPAGVPVTEGRWAQGPAGFGYGDGDDATVFPGMRGKYARLAIRRKVALPAEVPPEAKVFLRVNYDDGFIAWLDGREIARRNVEKETRPGAKVVPENHEAGDFVEIPLGEAGTLFSAGPGILALEGYNVSRDSSDFTLDPRLEVKWGGRSLTVLGARATWEYLAGAEPEENWQTQGGEVKEPAKDEADPVAGLRFRPEGGEWRTLPVGTKAFAASQHRVRYVSLTGLPAGKEVELQLTGRDGSGSKVHRFRTAPADDRVIRFVTGGDLYHRREPMDAMNRCAGELDPMFGLLGGDLAYTNDANPERWFGFIDSWVEHASTPDGRLLPMVVAIGNHEVKHGGYRPADAPGPAEATEYFSLFHTRREGLANDCFDLGEDFSIVTLDSGHSATVDSQTDWLERVLAERRGVKRVFACYHRPAWGCGTKGDALEIQQAWCPLFEKHMVDAVLENDHHVFCRSHPIRGGRVDEVRGIPYLGSGAWSVDVRKVEREELAKRPWIAKASGTNHLYLIEAGSEGWTAEAKTADGQTFDRVSRRWRR